MNISISIFPTYRISLYIQYIGMVREQQNLTGRSKVHWTYHSEEACVFTVRFMYSCSAGARTNTVSIYCLMRWFYYQKLKETYVILRCMMSKIWCTNGGAEKKVAPDCAENACKITENVAVLWVVAAVWVNSKRRQGLKGMTFGGRRTKRPYISKSTNTTM